MSSTSCKRGDIIVFTDTGGSIGGSVILGDRYKVMSVQASNDFGDVHADVHNLNNGINQMARIDCKLGTYRSKYNIITHSEKTLNYEFE